MDRTAVPKDRRAACALRRAQVPSRARACLATGRARASCPRAGPRTCASAFALASLVGTKSVRPARTATACAATALQGGSQWRTTSSLASAATQAAIKIARRKQAAGSAARGGSSTSARRQSAPPVSAASFVAVRRRRRALPRPALRSPRARRISGSKHARPQLRIACASLQRSACAPSGRPCRCATRRIASARR